MKTYTAVSDDMADLIRNPPELMRQHLQGKEWWGIRLPTPGSDRPCVWPHFMAIICRFGYYVQRARDQDRIFWTNYNEESAIFFRDKVACDELAAMIGAAPLWDLAQRECRAKYATGHASGRVHMEHVKNQTEAQKQ